MGRNRVRARNVVILVLLFVGVFGMGFYAGVKITIHEGLVMAKEFVTIDLNEEMIYQALFQYKNQIGLINSCNDTKILSTGTP